MASATLRLTVDPVNGKRTITISYASDGDALPHEHEDAHRALLEKLFEGGIAKPGDAILIEREGAGVGGDVVEGEGEPPQRKATRERP